MVRSLNIKDYWLLRGLSGSFSVGWAKAGIAIVRNPDNWDIVGTLDPSALHIPKGFGLGPLAAEI